MYITGTVQERYFHNPKGIKLITTFRLGLSHLHHHEL